MTPGAWLAAVLLGFLLLGTRPAAAQSSYGPAGFQAPPVQGSGEGPTSPQSIAAQYSGYGSAGIQATPVAGAGEGPVSLLPVLAQDSGDGSAGPQAVSGADAGQLRNYGRQVGQDWLKDTLGVDLQSLQVVWDPATWRFVSAQSLADRGRAEGGASGQPVSPSAGAAGQSMAKGISLRLVQTSDLTHLSEGTRDVPYNVEVKGAFRPLQSLSAIDTSLKIPLSPYDYWRADASMPMDMGDPWWWGGLGLGKNVALRSGFNSRLGFNQVETGMRTQWDPGFWGPWNLDYAWDLHYGEGSGESTNWLKFSKEF